MWKTHEYIFQDLIVSGSLLLNVEEKTGITD